MRNYGLWARVIVSAGTILMVGDYLLGPFGREPGVIFAMGTGFIVIGAVMIPSAHTRE